jgi:hypothetical protein
VPLSLFYVKALCVYQQGAISENPWGRTTFTRIIDTLVIQKILAHLDKKYPTSAQIMLAFFTPPRFFGF